MNVLSLFDGISCGKVALKRAGFVCDKYFSSEIDKYAIQVSQDNHQSIIQLGDIKQIDTSQLPKIDLLLAGFPCQSFSIAGKRKGFKDDRGNLFFDLIRIFNEVKPKYFLFENVASMKKEHREILDEKIGVKSIMINSALVSAQQRKRLYWTNIPNIEQPEDRGILLKDIIEDDVVDRDKSYCIDANYYKGGNLKSYFEKGRRQLVFAAAQRGRNIVEKKRKDVKGAKTHQRFETSYSEKNNTLTSVQKDSLLLEVREATKKGYCEIPANCGVDLTQPNSKTRRGRKMESKSNCLTAGTNELYWNNGYTIRKLTPVECERLQTLPDNYTSAVSDTQRYKCLGNGWTVDVIAHILKQMEDLS